MTAKKAPKTPAARRVVGVIRISNLTDETTAPERQREAILAWAASMGAEVVGWAEDLDVSGKVSPAERRGLGPWLTEERAGQWDALAAVKIDRISRKLAHFAELVEWCSDRSKSVVAFQDGVDTATDVGRLVAHILAMFAEFERERIASRVRDFRVHAAVNGLWTGGTVPYGYRVVPNGSGNHTLAPDPTEAAVLRTVVANVLGGSAVHAECVRLNREGIPPKKGRQWHAAVLQPMLRSRALLGEAQTGDSKHGKRQRTTRNGATAVMMATAGILDVETFHRLQAALDARSLTRTRTAETSPALGVAHCECGQLMYAHRFTDQHGKRHEYVRCRTQARPELEHCGNPAVRLAPVLEALDEAFLEALGDVEYRVRRLVPGENHDTEIADLDSQIIDLTALTRTVGAATRAAILAEIADLDAQRERLAALPSVPDRFEWVAPVPGATWGDRYRTADRAERRIIAMMADVRVIVHRDGDRIGVQIGASATS